MELKPLLCSLLTVGAVASICLPMAGCGGESEAERGESSAMSNTRTTEPKSEYHKVLLGFRDAALAGKIYDAYGWAEYFPPTQRAAVDAFCFVADRMLDDGEAERFADSAYLSRRITRKAAADMKFERDVVAPVRLGRSIRKLTLVLELSSLDQDLAERYVRACY